MAASYSNERKIEILTYARDNGVTGAMRHFNVPKATILRWNKELKIYTPQTREYPMEKRREILDYVRSHNIAAAVRHFGVSRGVIDLWNRELRVYKSPQHKFTPEQKLEVLHYARDFGVVAATDKYDVDKTLIIAWNKKFHIYQEQKEYTPSERKKILIFADTNGLTQAEREFDVPTTTMLRWNKEYKIYTFRRAASGMPYSATEQIAFLNRAKRLYDRMPISDRSANRAFLYLASKYPVTLYQLSTWNKKYNIVPRRSYVLPGLTQADINNAQSALNAARGRVSRAARQAGMSEEAIRKLKRNKKITFKRGRDKILTNPPVGRRKSGLIAEIIQMLQNQSKK